MAILAMTRFTFWVGFASFVACIVMMVLAVVPSLLKNRPRVKPRIRSLLLRATIECLSLWAWLAFALPLLAWMFLLGDNNGYGFYDYTKILAARVAIVISLIAYIRVYWKGATTGYLRFRLWISSILLLSFVTVQGYESIRLIDGINADSAAQRVFARLSPYIDVPVRFVEDAGALPVFFDPSQCKAFWILGPNEPRGRFSIRRHKWFGWQFAHNEYFPPSREELDRAKQSLANSTNRDRAVIILNNVIANYPNTPAETEAEELLKSINEPTP